MKWTVKFAWFWDMSVSTITVEAPTAEEAVRQVLLPQPGEKLIAANGRFFLFEETTDCGEPVEVDLAYAEVTQVTPTP